MLLKSAIALLLASLAPPLLVYFLHPLTAPAPVLSFLGSLHPVFLHFPVVLLCLVPLFELLNRSGRFPNMDWTIRLLLLLGAILAIVTASLGLLLYLTGDYSGKTILYHRWMGSSLPVLFCLLLLLRAGGWLRAYFAALVAAVALMVLTAHQGGKLTHGEMHLPLALNPWAEDDTSAAPPLAEMRVFADVVKPILGDKCGGCHNADIYKGELDVTSYASLVASADADKLLPVEQGDVKSSGMFHRLTLPLDDEDVMPPRGKRRLTHDELEILGWWLLNGHRNEERFLELKPDKEITGYVSNLRNRKNQHLIDAQRRELAADIEAVESKYGIPIRFAGDESTNLVVNTSHASLPITDETVRDLKPLQQYIVELDLEGSQVTDDSLPAIGRMQALRILNLRRTGIAGEHLDALNSLEQLQVLNLSETHLYEGALEVLDDNRSLQRIYAWHTGS
jgi:uncharacterized membrane protein